MNRSASHYTNDETESDIDLTVTDLGPAYRAAGDGGISSGCGCKGNTLEDSDELDGLVD